MKRLEEIYAAFIKKAEMYGVSAEELVFGEGAKGGIMLIGEAPGKDEVAAKRPFVGKAGRILDGLLSETGISRNELFITNTVKFRPCRISPRGTRSNRPPTREEIELCGDCLSLEIETVAPRLIVTLGNVPLKAVSGLKSITIGECHGRLMYAKGRALFPLYHPASLIYNQSLAPVHVRDALALSEAKKSVFQEKNA